MLLRVSYGGGKAFAMFYRFDGKLRRKTLGWFPAMSLAEAREAGARLAALSRWGRTLVERRSRRATPLRPSSLSGFRRDKRDAKPTTVYQIEGALKHDVLPLWGGRD